MAINLFYAIATLVGGVGAPALFGALIESKTRGPLLGVYIGAALLMFGAAATE